MIVVSIMEIKNMFEIGIILAMVIVITIILLMVDFNDMNIGILLVVMLCYIIIGNSFDKIENKYNNLIEISIDNNITLPSEYNEVVNEIKVLRYSKKLKD